MKQIPITKDVLASKNKRFVNFLIDQAPQYAFPYILVYSALFIGEITGNYTILDYLTQVSVLEDLAITISFYILYFYVTEIFTQRTLGKYVTQTMVVSEDGGKPSEKSIFIRSLCRLIPFEAFSFLGEDARGWHDSISKTHVVDVKKYIDKQTTETELELLGQDIDS